MQQSQSNKKYTYYRAPRMQMLLQQWPVYIIFQKAWLSNLDKVVSQVGWTRCLCPRRTTAMLYNSKME